MNHDDPLFVALSKLPALPVDEGLSGRIRVEAHAELGKTRTSQRARRPWLDLGLAAVACTVAVLHMGWAVTFVSALYR